MMMVSLWREMNLRAAACEPASVRRTSDKHILGTLNNP